jgi:hypothetical protein
MRLSRRSNSFEKTPSQNGEEDGSEYRLHPQRFGAILYIAMHVQDQNEARAIERLIAEIDTLDQWRDRVGRRIIYLFACVFTFAIAMLIWVAKYARENPVVPLHHPGPQVQGVLRSTAR